MRWSTCVKGAGLLLAGLAGVIPAQGPVPGGPVPPPGYGGISPPAPQYAPYVAPAMPYYQGYHPGCPVPGLPHGMVPPAMLPPGVTAPAPSAPTAPSPTTPAPTTPSGVTNAAGTGRDTGALTQAAAAAAAADAGPSTTGAGGGGERGSGAVASLAPNMFGDIFGAGRIVSTVPADRLALVRTFLNNQNLTEVRVLPDGRLAGATNRGGFTVLAGARNVRDLIPFTTAFYQAAAQLAPVGGGLGGGGFGTGGPPAGPVLPTPEQFGLQVLTIYSNGAEFSSVGSPLPPRINQPFLINAPSQARLDQLTEFFFARTGGKVGTPVFVRDASGAYFSQNQTNPLLQTVEAAIFADYLVTSTTQAPSSGGIVGRQKISDDNSPFPRDRIIFNYDYYSATPLGFYGSDVHRFSPGFEITFFDQWASVEIRTPFAGTLSSNILADAYTPRETVFGNVVTALKWLFYRSDVLSITGGSSFAFPTAPDQYIRLANTIPLVKFSNDSVVITPFVAAFLSPSDRLVIQGWWAVAFDTLGSGVSINPDLTGLVRVDTYREPALSQLDGQISYWFLQNNGAWSWLEGLAGFIELHHNTNLGRPKRMKFGNFAISDGSKYNDLNLGAGLIFNLGNAATISLGVVSPLRQEPNRGFDYQIGLRGSLFFGPTLRDRQAIQLTTF